jgi:chorismate dehydratase
MVATAISKTANLPRLAASSYLNTAPLIWSFQHGGLQNSVELTTDAAPARCADLLEADVVDAALVPVIEYQRMANVKVIPRVCVGSHSAVRSVVLVSKHAELERVRTVALDRKSRTSQVLVKVIFKEFIGVEPIWTVSGADVETMLADHDAALVIGDPGMTITLANFKVFDLANLWHSFTATGFVFAMWMAKASAVGSVSGVDFVGARDEGLKHLDEIVSASVELPLPVHEIRKYLTENITFEVDEGLERGMLLYFELAKKHGLIETVKPLEYFQS